MNLVNIPKGDGIGRAMRVIQSRNRYPNDTADQMQVAAESILRGRKPSMAILEATRSTFYVRHQQRVPAQSSCLGRFNDEPGLEVPLWGLDPIEAAEVRLDLERAIGTLSPQDLSILRGPWTRYRVKILERLRLRMEK